MIYLNYIKKINDKTKIALLLFFDFILIAFSIYLTEVIYLGYLSKISNALLLYFFINFSFYCVLSFVFKIYKQLNRFFGLHYIQNIFVVTILITIFLFLFKFIYDFRYLNSYFIILQNLLFLLLITISRTVIQKLYFHNSNPDQNQINTVIFGAGSDGINLYRKLKNKIFWHLLMRILIK